MPKITQEINKNGKAAFTKKVNSPTDKGRGVMPPPSKAHKKGKGKGSYDRKNAFEEDEQLPDPPSEIYVDKEHLKKKKGKTSKFKDFRKDKDETPLKDRIDNALKESTNLHKFIEAIMTNNHAQAHKQLKQAVNSKIQKRIAQEIDNPLF